jgi:lipopolysaccharide export system protein LptA
VTAALLLALSLAAAPHPRGREQMPRGPVRVDAESAQYAFQRHEVTFSGKRPVVLTREDATLTCRRMVAKTDDAGQIVAASCVGEVKLERGLRVVTCDHADFEEADARVICTGNAVLKDAGSEARGEVLTYDLRADEVKLEGNPTFVQVPGEEVDQRRRESEERRKARKADQASGRAADARTEPRKEKRP